MYKLVIRKWSMFKLNIKEKIIVFHELSDLFKAIDTLKNCEYFVTDENNILLNTDELRLLLDRDGCIHEHNIIDLFYQKKFFKKSFDGFMINIEILQNRDDGFIETKFTVDNREIFNKSCLKDSNLFSTFELFLYFQESFTKLKDVELVYQMIESIFM